MLSQLGSTAKTLAKREAIGNPTGGLNARDAYHEMGADDLLVAVNVVCRKSGAETRPGFYNMATGLDGPVQTLVDYQLPSKTVDVFAATPSKLYRLSGGVGPAVEIGTNTNGWMSTATLSNPGSTFLYFVNGTDAPRLWNGSALITPTFVPKAPDGSIWPGFKASKLHLVCSHHTMFWFAEQNSLRLWYLDHNAIQGPLQMLDLSPLCRKGGSIIGIASNGPGGGRTIENKLHIVTSEGELVIWNGTYPKNAATWSWAGTYEVGIPIGRRCFADHGGTLYLLTTDGIVSVAHVAARAQAEQEYTAVTDKIRELWLEVTGIKSDAIAFLDGGKIGFKVVTMPDGRQLVQEGQTGAWSLFDGLNAQSFCDVSGSLYFGSSTGTIGKLAAESDDGRAITCYVGHAYSQFKTPARKLFKRARLKFRRVAPATPKIGMMTDYQDLPARFAAQPIDGAYWRWSELKWDQTPTPWTKEQRTSAENLWRTVAGRGHAGSLLVSWQSVSGIVYQGADIMFESGGML